MWIIRVNVLFEQSKRDHEKIEQTEIYCFARHLRNIIVYLQSDLLSVIRSTSYQPLKLSTNLKNVVSSVVVSKIISIDVSLNRLNFVLSACHWVYNIVFAQCVLLELPTLQTILTIKKSIDKCAQRINFINNCRFIDDEC